MIPKKRRGAILIFLAAAALSSPATLVSAMETGPDTVVLDTLASNYEPVNFDHAMHVGLTENNCARCHHHTTGQAPVKKRCLQCHEAGREADSMACKDCHAEKRFEADYLGSLEKNPELFHIDKLGLKGAYHRNCMGCHQEMGGPSGCQDCHVRNDRGDAYFNSGKYAPAPSKGHQGEH